MNVLVRIKRFDPEKDKKPYWADYRVEVDPIDRLLDAMNPIKWTMDGSLTYRRSCAHGVCGSDAMRINGRNRLACKVLMRDVGDKVTIEPDRKSTRLNSSHSQISYAVFCLKKKKLSEQSECV